MNNKEWLDQTREELPGWYSFIKVLDERLDYLFPRGYQIDQIKEKFGTLRFYCRGDAQDDIVHDIARCCVTAAESMSARICMYCGEPGKTRLDVSWHCTLCDACFAKQYPDYKKTEFISEGR